MTAAGLGLVVEKIVKAGERIYAERYKADFERDRFGQFVVIDVSTGEAYPAEFSGEAMLAAKVKAPTGLFHLIRIGFPGAFKLGYRSGRSGGALLGFAARSPQG